MQAQRQQNALPFSKLVLATHNNGKVKEIAALMAPFAVDVVSAGSLGLPEPEETGATFTENAEIKSRASANASGLLSLADDSGLAVEALGGAPGIYSARWAGPGKDFSLAMQKVQAELEKVNASAPTKAHFVCVLSLAFPDGKVENFTGEIHGTLIFPPRGSQGFGYDPMFVPDGHTRTFGEMAPAEKHAISHRAIAFGKLLAYLKEASHG